MRRRRRRRRPATSPETVLRFNTSTLLRALTVLQCLAHTVHTHSLSLSASLDQVLDLALDLRRLRLEKRALPEDLVQQGVVLQLVPAISLALLPNSSIV